jgi:hypothetical protein
VGEKPVGSQLYDTLTGEPEQTVIDSTGKKHSLHGEARELLQPVFRGGTDVHGPTDIHRTRDRALANWQRWKALDMDTFPYGLSPALQSEKESLLTPTETSAASIPINGTL